MVMSNTTNHDTKEATRKVLRKLAILVSRINLKVMDLLSDDAPQELVKLLHHTLMEEAVEQAMETLSKLEDSGIPAPSCN